MGVASVLRHLVTGGLLVALDFLVFWTLQQVTQQVTEDVVARGEAAASSPSPSSPSVLETVVTPLPPPSAGHRGDAGERLGPGLRHLQRPGGGVQRPAERKHHRHQQEVSEAAVAAGNRHLLPAG